MDNDLTHRRIAFLVANEGVEQVELTTPWDAVRKHGGIAELVAPKSGHVHAMHHLDHGDSFTVDHNLGEVDASDYDGVVLPGGVANPDQLRLEPAAIAFVQALFAAGVPAAAICHAPWTLVEAGLVAGRTLTSWPSLQTDIRNAAGTWVDEEVHVCEDGPNVLVTSRKPDDLDAFCRGVHAVFAATTAHASPRAARASRSAWAAFSNFAVVAFETIAAGRIWVARSLHLKRSRNRESRSVSQVGGGSAPPGFASKEALRSSSRRSPTPAGLGRHFAGA